jgi:hypothetical protein
MGRVFSFVATVIVLAAGMYFYAHQAESTSAAAGVSNPKAAINITGVRSDLLTIAQAERGYFALEGKYASLDDLISSRSLSVARQRPPYNYEVDIMGNGFRVLATRSGDDGSGAPSQISLDENMQFSSSQ